MNPFLPIEDDAAWRQMLEYLDGTLPADGVTALNERLRADADLRGRFTDLLIQQIKLKELAEEAVVLAEEGRLALEQAADNIIPLTLPVEANPALAFAATASPNASPRPVQFRSFLALAATLTLLAVAAWWFMQPTRLARLSLVEGNVEIERAGRKFAAVRGEFLRSGDRLFTSVAGHATFTYLGEATEISLEPVTHLRLDQSSGGKRAQLERGNITAAVAKQRPGTPLRLVTPQTDVVVVGTRFKLACLEQSTRLEVFEGAVSILQSFEGPPLLVPAGHGVTVTPGQVATLQRLPGDRGMVLLEQWDQSGNPTNQTTLNQFMFAGADLNAGHVRVRGYLHPPRSGAYSFQVSASDGAELWLSDSDQPTSDRRIWPATGDAQTATALQLRADRRYYFELRCPPAAEPPSATVSWTIPGGLQRVIYGEYLSPFSAVANP